MWLCLIFSKHILVKSPPPQGEGKNISGQGGNIWNIKLVKKLPDSEPFPYRAMTNGESFATGDNMYKLGRIVRGPVTVQYISGKNLFNIYLIGVTGTNILIHMNVLMYN